MKEYIKSEIFNSREYNFLKLCKVLFFNITLRFVFILRLRNWLKKRKVPLIPLYMYNKLVKNYGCFIGYHSKIGLGVKFPHPNGIVIGADTIIGKNCTIYQQVTFGGKVIGDAQKGNYPKLGDNIIVFSGAKIIGNITIGDNVIIGANSVVNKSIPANSIVAGVPAKILKNLNEQSNND